MRLLFTLLASICLTPVSAQIFNGNFESWINFENYLLLQGWEIYAFTDEASVTRDFDSYEGLYAANVAAQDTGAGSYGNASTLFAITEVPATLEFFVKTSSQQGSVHVEAIFYNGEEAIETFSWTSAEETIADWTFISIPLDQDLEGVTTGRVNITAEVGDFADGSAVISVDQLGFGEVTGLVDNKRQAIKLYPNPACDIIRFAAANDLSRIEVTDLSGKTVGLYSKAEMANGISVQELPQGCYTIIAYLLSGNVARQKLVVAR